MLKKANFFYKLKNIGRFYRQVNKQKSRINQKTELYILAKLEISTTNFHEDINNFEKQEKIIRLRKIIGNIETMKAKDAALRSRVK
jgi:hypothetical protein